MKTICAALGMAALLTFSASADTLTLSKDQILDFGDAVDVLDGSRTYFGKQIKDWAEHKNFGKTAETVSHDLKEKTNEKRRKPRLVWRRRKSRTVWRKSMEGYKSIPASCQYALCVLRNFRYFHSGRE